LGTVAQVIVINQARITIKHQHDLRVPGKHHSKLRT